MVRPLESAWEEFLPFLDYDVEIRRVLCQPNWAPMTLRFVIVPRADVANRTGRGFLSPAERVFLDEQHRLVRFAFLLSGDLVGAEDAVAEVFARSWRAIAAGTVDHPGAYLRRGVVNELHRQGRRRIFERAAARRMHLTEPDVEGDVADRDRMLVALRGLPRRQREVLVLRFWEDRSVADTVSVLGISVGSVKTHTHRGLVQLRNDMEVQP